MTEIPLLAGVVAWRSSGVLQWHHPGLSLDKFSLATTQDNQKKALDSVCKTEGEKALLGALHTRRNGLLRAGKAKVWTAATAGPLTLHLSRANALENAGIALHPLYGFAYLPGSGLKGAARAYAETIWLPGQPDRQSACREIATVFGCAPHSDDRKHWLPEERQMHADSQAGAVVFHDAWPDAWPKLLVDIAAIHHPEYYQAGDSSVPPPGDWETPSLISFLAIQPGTAFRFALSPRRGGPGAELLDRARNWLNGALATLGIGAKTAAGYGLFQVKDVAPPAIPPGRAAAEFELTLVTPAFLAGGAQGKEDCDLRGATLRGHLRWWWRTMHAAHLEPGVLRRLETAVWGASSEGSAVQLRVTPLNAGRPEQFNFKQDSAFRSKNGIPTPPQRGVTGVSYLSYGMADKPGEFRYYRQPGDKWALYLSARASEFRLDPRAKPGTGVRIEATAVLAEAMASLWLLSIHGSVGAKARKGFGCFDTAQMPSGTDLTSIKKQAEKFRQHCCVPINGQARPKVSTLENMRSEKVVLGSSNPWYAIDALGRAYQLATKGLGAGQNQDKDKDKELLGIPRKNAQSAHPRFASAVHLHISTAQSGLVARVTTFDLIGMRENAPRFLEKIRNGICQNLEEATRNGSAGRAALYPPAKGRSQPAPGPTGSHAPLTPRTPPHDTFSVGQRGFDGAGEEVEIVALEDKNLLVRYIFDRQVDTVPIGDFRPKATR